MAVFECYPCDGSSKWVYCVVTTILSIVPVMLFYKLKERWQITKK